MKRIGLLLACLASLMSGAQAGELFRWMGKDGKMHYSDTRPTDVADVERIKLSSQAPQNDDLPYETQVAQQNFPVTLYVTTGCGTACDMARRLLNKRGVPFSENLLKTQEEIDAFYKMSGSGGVPTLAIGKNYLGGVHEAKWNTELDVAGYPKTASYRQRVAPPKAPPAPVAPPAPQATSAPAPAPEKPAPENQATPAEPAAQ